MQAFIPAAGLGTRLLPLTEHRPKALVEVEGVPLLKIAINSLSRIGVSKIVINVHHFSDMIVNYLTQQSWPTEILISDETDLLLDTGGGLKKAEPLFNPTEPILIHNVDVLSGMDLPSMVQLHRNNGNLVTLAVSDRETSRYLLFDSKQQLIGWYNRRTGEAKWVDVPTPTFTPLAFSGIAILEPQVLSLLPPCNKPYPIIPCYLRIAQKHRIGYFLHQLDEWMDVGTPQRLSQAQSWYHSLQK
ncbi:MAG: nucleotidyltransferase family protein [Bacteroidales bacterium]|nr:nucleotidyltransferase family protein [Bacteroidales bacterium]